MKKRLLALLLALMMALSLAACGGTEDGKTEDTVTVGETQTEEGSTDAQAPQETPEETEVPPEETPADDVQETPADTAQSVPAKKEDSARTDAQKPVSKPAAKPVQKPAAAAKPADTASKPAESKAVDLKAFYDSLTKGDEMPAMMQVEGEALEALYPGLSAVKTSQCAIYTAMISAVVGEIALVQVENTADVQTVKDIFQARIQDQVGDDQNPGGAWYPESIEGWKNGSRIVSNGNYVMMVALAEGADCVVSSFQALF